MLRFNASYSNNVNAQRVLVMRTVPEHQSAQNIPDDKGRWECVWQDRFEQITLICSTAGVLMSSNTVAGQMNYVSGVADAQAVCTSCISNLRLNHKIKSQKNYINNKTSTTNGTAADPNSL